MTTQTKTLATSTTGASAKNKTNDDSSIALLSQQFINFDKRLQSSVSLLNPKKTYVATDSEWDSGEWKPNFGQWLQSTALVVYFHADAWRWHLFIFNSSSNLSAVSLRLLDSTFTDECYTLVNQLTPELATTVERWLAEQELKPESIEIIGKYSPLDYHAYFGEDLWLHEIVDSGLASQKRCLRFENTGGHKGKRLYKPSTLKHYYSLRDLQGLNSGSLKKQGDSVDVKLLAKDTMDAYKSQFKLGYETDAVTATVYNICDTFAAMEITLAYLPLVNEVVEYLGMPLNERYRFTLDNLPHTTGSLVAQVFCKWLDFYPRVLAKQENWTLTEDELTLLHEKWRLILWRNAIKKDSINGADAVLADAILQGQIECDTVADYKSHKITTGKGKKQKTHSLFELVLDEQLMRRLFAGGLYEQASAKVFGSDVKQTSVYAAVVQGGRCNNSNPFIHHGEYILDVDLSSCYGSTLRKLTYPIGLPTVYSRSTAHGETLESFKKVYDCLDKELVKDLWFADVSTSEPLTFTQDLLFSSHKLTPEIIRRAVTGTSHEHDEEIDEMVEVAGDVKKIPSEFVLCRRELEHARVCWSSKQVIDKVASNREKGELNRKLVCNTLVYYPKSQEATDLERFCDEMLASKGAVYTDDKNNLIDNRSRSWFGVKLEYFIGALVNRRKELKKEMRAAYKVGDKTLAKALDAKQEMYKLFVNTLYGVLASVYFTCGNTVLANVITDKARVGAWMLSKPLRTMLEITDGGFYSPLEVAYIRDKGLPGLNALADWRIWKDVNASKQLKRTIEPLGNMSKEEWHQFFYDYDCAVTTNDKETLDRLNVKMDTLAADHIQEFWQLYELEFEFGLEHKYDHTSWKAAYMSKADYCLLPVGDREPVIKKRGAKKPKADEYSCSSREYTDPAFEMLYAMATGTADVYDHRSFYKTDIVKVGEYQEAKVSTKPLEKEPETLAEHKQAGTVVPGWEIISLREPRQLNNRHIYIATFDQYESIIKRKATVKGDRVQWFERDVNNPSRMCKAMTDDCLNISKDNRKST